MEATNEIAAIRSARNRRSGGVAAEHLVIIIKVEMLSPLHMHNMERMWPLLED